MRIQDICFHVLAIAAALAATQRMSGDTHYSPAVNSTSVNIEYIGSFKSIRDVDFANLYYYDGDGKSGEIFQLRRGSVAVEYPLGGDEVNLDSVYYFQPGNAAPGSALVQLRRFSRGGSSGMDCVLYVFQIDESALVLTQKLRFDLQANGTCAKFDSASNTLTVRARTADDSPHCCAKSLDVVKLVWKGKVFEDNSHRTVPIKD